MESSSVSVCEAVSTVLCTLEEQRKLAYSRSSIQLVSELENKYPLSDVIMRRLAILGIAVQNRGMKFYYYNAISLLVSCGQTLTQEYRGHPLATCMTVA